MDKEQLSNRKFFILSVLLHAFVLGLFLIQFNFSGPQYVLKNNSMEPTIQATVMQTPLMHVVKPQPQLPPPPSVAPQIPKPVVTPPQPALTPSPKKVVSTPKPVVVPPKPDAIAIDVKKQKRLRQEQLQKQLLADLQKQTQKTKKNQKNQKALQQAFENEMRNLSKKSLQQMNNDNLHATQSQFEKMHGIVDKYRALILDAVGHRWLIPTNADKNATTKLLISLKAGGVVTDVHIVESSGNIALDNSARAAVFKASPLPVPTNGDEFKPFQQFVLVFRPKMFQPS